MKKYHILLIIDNHLPLRYNHESRGHRQIKIQPQEVVLVFFAYSSCPGHRLLYLLCHSPKANPRNNRFAAGSSCFRSAIPIQWFWNWEKSSQSNLYPSSPALPLHRRSTTIISISRAIKPKDPVAFVDSGSTHRYQRLFGSWRHRTSTFWRRHFSIDSRGVPGKSAGPLLWRGNLGSSCHSTSNTTVGNRRPLKRGFSFGSGFNPFFSWFCCFFLSGFVQGPFCGLLSLANRPWNGVQ